MQGTSMPIGIPSMQRRVVVGGSFENGDDGFIPPHLVEQQVTMVLPCYDTHTMSSVYSSSWFFPFVSDMLLQGCDAQPRCRASTGR